MKKESVFKVGYPTRAKPAWRLLHDYSISF